MSACYEIPGLNYDDPPLGVEYTCELDPADVLPEDVPTEPPPPTIPPSLPGPRTQPKAEASIVPWVIGGGALLGLGYYLLR